MCCECNQGRTFFSNIFNRNVTEREMGLEAAHEGTLEEFHQKRGNGYMNSYHKERRLKIIKELHDFRKQ